MEAKTQLLIPENEELFHVLAVDDSVIERKMLEKLLTISSFHGNPPFLYFFLININLSRSGFSCYITDSNYSVIDVTTNFGQREYFITFLSKLLFIYFLKGNMYRN